MTVTANPPAARITRAEVRPGQLFIAGAWRDTADGGRIDAIDPSTGQTVTTVAAGTTDDVDAAVAAGRAAFPTWRDTPQRPRPLATTIAGAWVLRRMPRRFVPAHAGRERQQAGMAGRGRSTSVPSRTDPPVTGH